MKKIFILLLTLILTLSMCACGDTSRNVSPDVSPSDTVLPSDTSSSPDAENTADISSGTQDTDDSDDSGSSAAKTAAEACVGQSLEQLYSAVGEPDSSAYQDSCEQPDAQDGFLYYADFTVVTLKTDDGETVVRVR